MRVSGHPGTSESRNDQSVSSARAASGPVARVCPVSRPANGGLWRTARANSRSNSRASRSASRRATSPESATLSAVSRPATVPPWYVRRSGSSPTSSTRSPWERSRTSPDTTPAPGTPAKRRSMNRKSSSLAESARSRRSNSSGPCGQRSVPRASRRAECGSRTRASCTSLESRVARLGALRLQSHDHRPVRDADVPEQDEGGRPVRALVWTPEAQQLFDVEPAVRVLHDVDHRLTQVEFEEHDPAGREVERVVAHIDFWQPCDERRISIEQPDLRERQPGEERPTHVADLHRPGEDLMQRPLTDSCQPRP